MSSNENSLPPLNPLTEILFCKEKTMQQSSQSTQSTITKPPQGAKTIGSYLLGRNIGVGTFGKVYLAMHIPTSQKVAIKVIDKQKMSAVDVKRVKRQIQILKTVRHRHIVQLYQIIQTEKSVLLITQYLPNGELFQHIIKQKKIGQEEACTYFQQIISAVQYLHRNKIAHRDLKPENILLDFDKQLKLIDFGLGAFYKKNELKTFCGSPCYAAPEMVAAKKHYNPLFADLWSCGVILFSMLCGRLPFCDADAQTLYKKVLSGIYKIPSHVSPEAKNLIQGLLNLTPNKRMSIQQIKKHKWFNLIVPRQAYGLDIGDYISADNQLLSRLSLMGISKQNVKTGVMKNQKNKDTAAYYILMKKLIKGEDLIPSYMGDGNFNPKLIQKVQKKGVQDDTESIGSPENQIIIQSPDAPDIPQPFEQKQAGWWYDEHTSDEIKQVDHSELALFAKSILDVLISKYIFKPQIQKINEILQYKQTNQKTVNRNLSQKRQDQFYTNNKTHKNKVRNFENVQKDEVKNINEDLEFIRSTIDLIQPVSKVQTRHKSNLKKLLSLQYTEKTNISNKRLFRGFSKNEQIQPLLPKISKKLDQKIELKKRVLQKIYGKIKSNPPIKLPSAL